MKAMVRFLTFVALIVCACAAALASPAQARQSPIQFYTQGAAEYQRDYQPSVQRQKVSRAAPLPIARKYIGTNPTKMRRLWCANFVNLVEKKAGRDGTGSNFAMSFKTYGKGVALKDVRANDIVVMKRRGGGHVGYAAGPIENGRIKIVSGNSGGKSGKRRVTEQYYSLRNVVAVRRVA